jgi:hypothetical protein
MTRRITVSRAAAVRAAQDAKARRDAERLRREQMVDGALADFYEATAKAEALREQARVRAEQLVEQAELAAAEPERAARAAVLRLHGLGETREQIADLTGLRLVEVRAMLAESAAEPEPAVPATAAAGPRRVPVAQASAVAEAAGVKAAEPGSAGEAP